MPPIRVGVQLQPQHCDYGAMREAWLEAEELGCDTIWNWDHFYPLYGEPDGKHWECWTVLAAMAEVTSRAQIGSLVVCNSYRNPQLQADMARTIDHISGGRFIFGIGSGWFERDYEEFGYEFGTKIGRLRALEAALPLIYERYEKLNPPPTRRIPLMIGGGGLKVTTRIVARWADMWHSFGDVEVFREKRAALLAHCAEVGRDPGEIEITWAVPEGEVGNADGLLAEGVRHFVMGLGGDGKGFDLAPLRELLAWRDAQAG